MGGRKRDLKAIAGLPVEVSSFIGRRGDLATARQRLSVSRLLTLTGIGGVGKTRLAIRIAADTHRAFPDGVHLIQLDELREAALLSATVVTSLSDAVGAPQGDVGTLVEFLQDKHLLIILDNCEHLLAACGLLVERLLRSCPQVRVLATSREPLGIDGEAVLPVPSLPTPDLDLDEPSPPKLFRGYGAIELFADRANAVDPNFRLTLDNQLVVAEICQTLDGIPLAIELAAVRIRTLTLDEILGLLTDRFQLLAIGKRTASTRHQTLRASLDWSFGLCTEQEQRLWARLSVFAGAFELDGVVGVCSGDGIPGDQVLDLLSRLVEKSILTRDARAGHTSYRLLETVRQYGLQRLTDLAEVVSMHDRHLEWYADLVERSYVEWISRNQVSWVHRLTAERANLRAALKWGHSEVESASVVSRMAVHLGEYWLACGLLADGRHWVSQSIERTVDLALRTQLLCLDGVLQGMQGQGHSAAEQIEVARALARQLESRSLEAEVKCSAGMVATCTGDVEPAIAPMEEAVRYFGDLGDRPGLIRALWILYGVLLCAGQSERGIRHAQKCLDLSEEAGEVWIRSSVLWLLGVAAWQDGESRRSRELHMESLRLSLDLENVLGCALSLEGLAWLAAVEGQSERAAFLLGGASRLWSTAGTLVAAVPRLGSFREKSEQLTQQQMGMARYEVEWRRGNAARKAAVVRAAMGKEAFLPLRHQHEAPKLTRREGEVTRLIAYGMTDRQISAHLVIAQRTAEWHVERILRKLDFSSRTQVAAWWSEEGRQASERDD